MTRDDSPHPRRVRSFVRRAGRITGAQQRALDTLWPRFGIDYDAAPLDLTAVFGRRAPRVVEIGFGNGDALVAMAAGDPARDFIGIEVHEPGVGHCLLAIEKQGIDNVRLIRHDAVEVLSRQIPDAALDAVYLLFPDPWPKKRHHKRRIVQPAFAALLARKLKAGGRFVAATDWRPYAEHIQEVMDPAPGFRPSSERPVLRTPTRFQRRGEKLGHAVWAAQWVRT